ncbi:MAG: YraN family protein [Rhodobacterales bacterium]|nr:YraN family protein [Rhodobacterales bacterium]MDX5390128.1 YraN family protein [Rhodobacterales bacterium]MDX5489819.1 YraN family protein [Rhodobacterales bacterium]
MTISVNPTRGLAQPEQLDLPLQVPGNQRSTPGPEAVKAAGPSSSVQSARRNRGRVSYLSGLAAEDVVEKAYLRRGMALVARRWRGTRAEIDMIFADGAALIFVEVKKSRSFDTAIRSLGRAQCDRILEAATEFLGRSDRSQLTEMRFDLATVDNTGALDILENAFSLEG